MMKNTILILLSIFVLQIQVNLLGQSAKKLLNKAERKIQILQDKSTDSITKASALNDAFNLIIEAIHSNSKIVYQSKFQQNISILWDSLINMAVRYYHLNQFSMAYKNLEHILKLSGYRLGDTTYHIGSITFYTGLSAYNNHDYLNSEKYFLECIEKSYESSYPYQFLAKTYTDWGYESKAFEILQKGKLRYPDSTNIIFEIVNYYIRNNQNDSALSYLNNLILSFPDNSILYCSRGCIYEKWAQDSLNIDLSAEIGKFGHLAVNDYKKAIQLKPNYFEAIYNLGALYYNKGIYIGKEMDMCTIENKTFILSEYKIANDFFNKALPYLERAYILNKSDTRTVFALKNIYPNRNEG